MKKENFRSVIDLMRNKGNLSFDSHDFIECYRAEYERDYITMLVKNEHSGSAFQKANAEIARNLEMNADYLGIEKLEKVRNENDHGNRTFNQLWRILPVLMFFICFSSLSLYAQSEFDVPDSIAVEKYTHVDTAYVNAKIRICDEIIKEEGRKPKYQPALETYNYLLNSYYYYGSQKERRHKIMENAKNMSYSYKDVLTRKFNQEESEYVMYGDTIPLLRGMVNVPIEFYKLLQEDWKEFNGDYSKIFVDPFSSYREYNIYGSVKAYPIRHIYNSSYPDCAFVEDKMGYLIYDLEGNLKHFILAHRWRPVYTNEEDLLKSWCYINDFTENKYNIRSQDTEVIKAVEVLLKNDVDSEYVERVRAAQMVAALGSLVATNREEQKEILSEVNSDIRDTTVDYLKTISDEKTRKARAYVTQLKYDHSDEFERGRTKRIDSTSYYQSFVDGDGKCTHLVKIEYVQTAPFEAERKFTIIK